MVAASLVVFFVGPDDLELTAWQSPWSNA